MTTESTKEWVGVGIAAEVYPVAWRLVEAEKALAAGNHKEVSVYLSEIRRELNIALAERRPMPLLPYLNLNVEQREQNARFLESVGAPAPVKLCDGCKAPQGVA